MSDQIVFEDEQEKQKFKQTIEKRNEVQDCSSLINKNFLQKLIQIIFSFINIDKFKRKLEEYGKIVKYLMDALQSMIHALVLIMEPFITNYKLLEMVFNKLFYINNGFQYKGQVIFSTANMIVMKDLTTKSFKFISKENRFKNVTALYAIQKKKGNCIIAVGESSLNDDKQADLVVIYGSKQKMRILHQGIKGQVKQVYLNLEKKYCCGLIFPQGSNIPTLNLWHYKKDRLLASMQIKAGASVKFSMHPAKPGNIVITGQNYFRMWELFLTEKLFKESHNQLVPLKTEKENRFYDHTWITSSANPILVVLASSNRILLLQNDQLKKIIDIDVSNLNIVEAEVTDVNQQEGDMEDFYGLHTVLDDIMKEKGQKDMFQQQEKPNRIINTAQLEFNCVTSMQRGFILGGNRGCICLYDIEKNFSIVNKMSFEMKMPNGEDHKIFFLSSSSNDSIISVVSYDQNGNINYHLLNPYSIETEISPIQPFFSAGFHTKKINCISTSITKAIFATCSEDNTVKIWNYFDSENQEKKGLISQYFKEEPLSVALHPFGMFIAVAFSNGFKVFAILNDGLHPLKDVNLTNCKIVKYAHGGHFLLTNENKRIYIYDSIYYEQTKILDGHQALIRDVYIAHNDLTIISTCMNGFVLTWNILEPTQADYKTHEHQENSIYNCIAYDMKALKDNPNYKDEPNLFVGCSNEKYLCIYAKKCKELVAELPVMDCYITCLIVSSVLKCIIMGTNKGKIRVSVWPLDDSALEYEFVNNYSNKVMYKAPDFIEISVHSSAISSMALSHDQQYLFTGDEDGTLFMLKIKDVIQNGEQVDIKKNLFQNTKMEDKSRIDTISNDLFLAKISKIQEKNELKKKLSFEVVRLEQTKKIETQKLDNMHKQKVEGINKDFQDTMENDMKMKDTFVQKSNEEYNKLLKQYQEEDQKYKTDIENLKKLHEDKIAYEEQRNRELQEEIDKIKNNHKDELMKLLNQHKEDLKKLKLEFYDKCQKVQVKYSNVVDNAKNFGNAFITRLEKQENEYEKEIDENIKNLKEEITKVKKVNEELEEKNKEYIKDYEKLKREDEELQKKFEELFKKHNSIRYQNLKNDEDILKMQHQLLERLQVIDSKEETCKSAKDEQINLENFRYMLDQKIKSLQTEKGQLLDKISSKEKNLKEMFNELIKESNQNEEKYQKLKNLNAEIKVLENAIKKAEVEIFFNTNKLTSFQNNLSQIMKSNESVTVIGKKLHEMLEQCKDKDELDKFQAKKVITNDDIKEIIKTKQEKPNEVNDELLRQGKWMTKKLYLIKLTSKKLKDIRDDNINTILNQNTKLIEECNLLRGENERFRKEMKKIEKLLAEAIRKRQKLRSQQQAQTQNPAQLKKLIQKYDENTEKLKSQQLKLSNIKESIDELLTKSQEDLPKIPSQGQIKQQGEMMSQGAQRNKNNEELPAVVQEDPEIDRPDSAEMRSHMNNREEFNMEDEKQEQ